jgi:hypothetical protein
MRLRLRWFLGLCFVLLASVLFYLLYALWPVAQANEDGSIPDSMVCLFGYHFNTTADIRLILLVAVVGALGSYVHAATSFASFAGNRRLYQSWSWWYIIRVPVGASLSLIFYLAVRAGMFAVNAQLTITDASTFSFAAVGGLAGMFSKPAIDKLSEVFDTIFNVKEDRRDTLSGDYAKPEITGLDPGSVKQGATNAVVKVYGKGFGTESRVRFNGVDRDTVYVSEVQLKVTVKPDDAAKPAEIKVTVFNLPPTAATSNEHMLKIEPQ